MAAAFGSRGQSDYAAANSVLDQTATVLANTATARVLAIAWGPWHGAGMVSPQLETQMRKSGLHLIDLQAGSQFLAHELTTGTAPNVIAMAGTPESVTQLISQTATQHSKAEQ